MFPANRKSINSIIRQTAGGAELGSASVIQRVNPLVAVIFEIGKQIPQVEPGPLLKFVVDRTGEAPAFAIVPVLSDIQAVVVRNSKSGVRLRLNVVNSTAIVVIAARNQNAQLLGGAKPLAYGRSN